MRLRVATGLISVRGLKLYQGIIRLDANWGCNRPNLREGIETGIEPFRVYLFMDVATGLISVRGLKPVLSLSGCTYLWMLQPA